MRIYDLVSCTVSCSVTAHARWINALEVHPTREDLFVTAAEDATIGLWSISEPSGKLAHLSTTTVGDWLLVPALAARPNPYCSPNPHPHPQPRGSPNPHPHLTARPNPLTLALTLTLILTLTLTRLPTGYSRVSRSPVGRSAPTS